MVTKMHTIRIPTVIPTNNPFKFLIDWPPIALNYTSYLHTKCCVEVLIILQVCVLNSDQYTDFHVHLLRWIIQTIIQRTKGVLLLYGLFCSRSLLSFIDRICHSLKLIYC